MLYQSRFIQPTIVHAGNLFFCRNSDTHTPAPVAWTNRGFGAEWPALGSPADGGETTRKLKEAASPLWVVGLDH